MISVHDQVWSQVSNRFGFQFYSKVSEQIEDQVLNQISDQISSQVWHVKTQVHSQARITKS